jgi:hypothetical protein
MSQLSVTTRPAKCLERPAGSWRRRTRRPAPAYGETGQTDTLTRSDHVDYCAGDLEVTSLLLMWGGAASIGVQSRPPCQRWIAGEMPLLQATDPR